VTGGRSRSHQYVTPRFVIFPPCTGGRDESKASASRITFIPNISQEILMASTVQQALFRANTTSRLGATRSDRPVSLDPLEPASIGTPASNQDRR
jgi:hypothetical protein